MAPLVSLETRDRVTTLTLERPAYLNALSETVAADFRAAVARAAREPSKVVVLRGAGRSFSSGGDLRFIEGNMRRPKAALAPVMRRFYGSFLAVRDLPQVTIAQVHGAAVGAGLCLALACDLRTVEARARLCLNFTRLGLNPGMAAWPLARAVLGDARARELLLTARDFTGRDLHSWGGAALVAPTAAALARRTSALARRIAGLSGEALRLTKAETRLGVSLEPFLAFEARGQAVSFKSAELAEGVTAVRERRAPAFR